MMQQKIFLCKDCVNFIEDDKKKELYSCDYEYGTDMNFYDAILNVPEMYGCIEFEKIESE